ncbi:hypothetical protein QTP70_032796 [Hemibagrus guttatus]|uniref:ribonuclease H n=1 Tax=Hemibagrus guttatus TaxID=175788 RepID=A0AAE0Q6Y2_9TELE|nr:hypothetical protein QTP70_032796 [Hemibagrus guttatus]
MELVLNESVYVEADSQKGSREWSWCSAVPLECTSRSVRIRARHVDVVSQWSPLLTILGMDVPDQPQAQMYPQDPVLEVGGNVTVCCITPEGVAFSILGYGKQNLAVTRLSRRSYSAIITDLHKSSYTGTNVVCFSNKTILAGTVLFVGYPPGDEGLQCETRDLQSAECRWSKGRDTGLQKLDLRTNYTLNNRTCTEDRKDRKQCRSDRWESSWTLVAKNPLGMVQLSDSAHIKQRIRLLAPVNVKSEAEAWKARVTWSWTVEAYKTLTLLCEVQLDSEGQAQTLTLTQCNLKEISDCKVVVGESVARQHRMVVCRMTLMVCKKKRSKIEKKTKWWKLKKEECCEEFRQKLRQALGGQVVLPDDWETTAEVIRETGRKVLGVSSGRRKEDKETWWWNEEVQDSVQRKRLAKKKWDMDRTEENRQEYKELQRRVKREVSKAKQKAYDELYTRLDTREGEKDLYRLARQRDRDGKDVQQVRVIKDRDGRVLTSEESVQRRWKEYFEELMNEENEREKRVEGVNSVEQEVDKIRKDEVRKALKRMKSGKAVGPDDIPVEVWKCLGEAAVEFLASLFNRVLESERMPEEWRRSVLVPIFKNKGDVQSCSNYRGIKLMSHTMKLWERVVEARLRKVVEICEQQYGFMPRKSTTDAIFALRILMEKYRDGQRELHCVFVDLEKAYDRVPREELWYCMRKSGVAEKYVRVVQDMYERSRTVVRCAVGQTEEFKVEVGLHQGSALSPFLFAIVMDRLSEEVRQESPWTMMFADDIVICSESREQVEENLERWRFVLERRGMKVSGSKTEYMCVNEREGSGTVRLQGEEVKKVQEFKYLGSTVQSNGECGKEVKKRVQAGWNGWRKVWGVLCERKISARIKGKVYRTVVRAAMLYGLETVSLRKRQESELERNYTGVGLSSVVLDSLRPDTEYSFSIRCASLLSFWRWGDWSAPYSLHTHMYRPKAPDVWVWRTSEITGQVMWKSLSPRDSHGALTAYEVSQREGEEDGWTTVSLPPSVSRTPISLSNSSDIMVAVAARNPVGLSRRSTIIVPQYTADSELSVSELVCNGGGLTVSWNHNHNSTQGYVVEWLPTCCPASSSCSVQWERASSSNTSTIIQSGSLDPGVQYTISIFSLLPEASVLLQRHYGYGQEQVSSVSVGSLSALQSGSDIVLSWTPVPVCQQKGFILGHTVYLADASNLSLIANLTDPALSSYTVKSLPLGSYKFMVRSYNSAGEGMESTVAIKTESDTNLMLVEILVALGAMSFCFIIISVFCYRKREWVKKAFYPEIPGPKLTGDWSAPPGPLDLKPPPHSLVHIVESPDKEGLVTALGGQEEGHRDDESDNRNVEPDTDSDEPGLLRYYNQLVSDVSDRSSSSTDSAQTQVTYTGIQSPAYRPQNQPEALLEVESQESPGAGYKPQCSWRADPSENENFSLGSPTSVLSFRSAVPQTPEPLSLAKDFSNGYLLGEVLHRHQLQEDFHQFSKHSTANAKLNNFTRLEPTLQLLGVTFDLSMARAVMQGQQGAATRLLYQLYILLQKKTRLGLTSTMLETMQPAAVARLHRVEKHIYTQRLRTMVKREADVKMQKIAQRFDKRGRDAYSRSVIAEVQREERRRHLQEQTRLQDIQKHRQAHRKQQEIMDRIQTAMVQIPKPPVNRSVRAMGKHRQNHQPDTQSICYQIREFERNRMRLSPASCPASVSVQVNEEQMEEWNNAYVQKIRKRLEEDALAREEREKRRRRALIQQLHTHQTHEEMLREEQLIGRLMRQSQQEKRIAVQLMQIRQEKEVLRQNRILREREIHNQRLRDFQQALEREAVLLQQDQINGEAELCKERELHKRLMAERAQSKHHKHLNTCRGILEQIVDLATKVGEYRLLTANLVPVKLIREWKELWLSGQPLYEKESSPEQDIELEKLHILNEQDYTDYTSMTGEWAWPEEGESRAPPPNNDILGHIVSHLRSLANPPELVAPPPALPLCPLRACVLGKVCSGKTTCLNRISQAHGIHLVSADALIQEVLEAHRTGLPESQVKTGSSDSPQQEAVHSEGAEPLPAPHTEPGTHSLEHCTVRVFALSAWFSCGRSTKNRKRVFLMTCSSTSSQTQSGAHLKVPSGQAWVLDGFPVELSQAQLLEKALGGADLDQDHTQGQSHELAVDRNVPQAPPPASPVLHLALLLEVSDEQVLERYQHRKILGFQDAWPGLEEWFGVEQKILVRVDGDVDEESLYRSVETVLLHVMDAAEKGSHTRVHTTTDDNTSEITDIQKPGSDHCSDSRRPSASSSSIAEAPPPEPGSSSWVFVDDQLPKEMSENLLSQWENICSSYVSNIKAVMQNLRKERNLIIHHLYNIREEYKQYLMSPDLKQEFVCVWQREYNSVSDDMRHEEETKSELHQRLEDLRERLWDMCDKRRDEVMQEKAALTEDDWLQNHTSVLINHYCTLIQCIVIVCVICSPAGSAPSEIFMKSAGKKETETEDKKRPRVPSSTDSSKQKDYVPPDEKPLQDFHHAAVTAVTQMVTAEMQQLEQEENEELQQQLKRDTTHTQSHTPIPTTQSAKDKKKGGKKKGPPSPIQEPILPPPVEEDAEEVQERRVRNRIRLEYRAALKHEESSVCERLERVKLQCVKTLRNLQTRTEVAHREMEEWGGARFLSEVNSIDQLAAIIRHHIESGSRITHELTLACSNLFIDGDTRVVATPPPPPHPLPTEVTNQGSCSLTVKQLYGLHSHLLNIAPTGLVSCSILCEVLTLCVGSDVLCEAWMQLTDSQDCGILDWRQFLLSAARPWPLPSQTQLINTLTRFKEIDTAGGGVISLQQYLQVELWFPTQTELPVPDDWTDPQPYDRLTNLRKFFFTLFSDSALSPPMCDYMNMLLYFCAHPDPARGFTRALSLVTQQRLRYTHTHTTGLLQSYVCDDEEEEEFEGDEGEVSVDDVLRVVKNRSIRISSQQHTTAQNPEELQQNLVDVFKNLGFKPDEKIPLRLLAQQSVLQELMDSTQYLLAYRGSIVGVPREYRGSNMGVPREVHDMVDTVHRIGRKDQGRTRKVIVQFVNAGMKSGSFPKNVNVKQEEKATKYKLNPDEDEGSPSEEEIDGCNH